MSHFDEKSLLALTKLCRIECSEEERKKLLTNIESIVAYFDELQKIDTEGVPPCNHVLETAKNVMREDEAGETLDREIFLKNSPSHVGGMIRVPPVIKF
jgi:aspartyl-tRNA(Asn)/glutamyl-tRNA(Gln) amidotransferase subunit C